MIQRKKIGNLPKICGLCRMKKTFKIKAKKVAACLKKPNGVRCIKAFRNARMIMNEKK